MSQSAEVQTENLSIHGTGDVLGWLNEVNISFAFSSYQLGKLFLIGRSPSNELSVFHRNFDLCMGLAMDGNNTMYLASLYQIWKLTNILPKGQLYQDFDRLYSPQVSYITGELNTHDVALDNHGKVIFINTTFSCLASVSSERSFDVVWKPPFITNLAPEDRCHLNGLAMDKGVPRYVSMFAKSDEHEGWRPHRVKGGIIMDIATNEIVCRELSMPHSPRMYRGVLYVLNSGTGEFGYVDVVTGRFEAITFCPGFVRGLSFAGDYAIVGLSKLKNPDLAQQLPISENLLQHGFETTQCGFYMIHLKTGEVKCSLDFSGSINYIYDVVTLDNVLKPLTLGIEQDHIRRAILLPPCEEADHGELLILENIKS
jgi:uncharacterized protein (TIGR03032 family)